MSRLLVAVCLLALASVCLAEGQCFGSFSPGPNDEMPTCCWYSENTCCPSNNTAFVYLLDYFAEIQQELYNNLTDSGQNTSPQLNYCLSFYENAVCSLCDPDLPLIMPPNNQDGLPVLVMCDSFCDQWYNACADVSQIASRFENNSIANGNDLCMYFPQAIVVSGGAPLFNVSVESTDCYSGADQDEILASTCLPWYEEPSTPPPSTNNTPPPPPAGNVTYSSYNATSDADGDGDDDDNGNLYWLFFLLAAVVFVLLVVVVAVVGFVLWKRRQAAAAVTTDSNAYPDLDELDDYE